MKVETMGFRIKGSHIIAILLAGGLAAWMASGDVIIGGQTENSESAKPIAEREAERSTEMFKVRHLPLKAETRRQTILVRGRTSADAVISVRAETAGVVEQRLVDKGQSVAKGDLVCVIERGAREADVARARAQLVQAEAEFEANDTLQKKGFASENRLKSLKAALDAARAGLASAEQELGRTEIRANASGIVRDPVAEVGDMLTMGGTCVTLLDTDPMVFTGQVSERDIASFAPGVDAEITLVTGETAKGKIRYISPSADAQTRTFAVEIEFEPGSGAKDGMTAEARIALDAGIAFRIAPSWITLADDGSIGIRIVNDEDTVEFKPVKILAQEKNAFWITGPQDGDRIITLGQEYVLRGEKVETQLDTRLLEKLAEAGQGAEKTSMTKAN